MLLNNSNGNGQMGIIVQCSPHDLKPGKIGGLFQQGAKAAVLKDDPRIAGLWKSLFDIIKGSDSTGQREGNTWGISIGDLALNHRPGNVYVGDMLRFIPGALGHIARKIIVFKDSDNQIKTIPNTFFADKGPVSFNQGIIDRVWDVMQDVLRSALPDNCDLKNYAIKIDLLKYPDSPEELERIFTLLGDASGFWTRLGMRLDRTKAMGVSFFNVKVMRDLFALGNLIPGINIILRWINGFLFKFSDKEVPPNSLLVGEPHVDGPNFLTALISDRDLLCTEVHGGEEGWVELPLSSDSIAIFPSEQLSKVATIIPTIHRILFKTQMSSREIPKPNITLVLSVIPWPQKI